MMLKREGCKIFHTKNNADDDEAVESAETFPTTLIGDDTDLLILLCYHAHLNSCPLFFTPEAKKSSQPKK